MSTIFFGQKKTCCNEDSIKNESLCSSELSISAEARCSKEEAIREKAYLLWEEAGCPQGDGVDFWIEAEKQLYS